MKNLLALSLTLTLIACSQTPPPTDNTGNTPEAVVLNAYTLMFEGNYDAAEALFDKRLTASIFTPTHPENFESFYTKQIEPWTQANLRTKLIGNKYNPNVWRVRIWSEDGRGDENHPGAVHDLAQIDGKWFFVNWSDYPKG